VDIKQLLVKMMGRLVARYNSRSGLIQSRSQSVCQRVTWRESGTGNLLTGAFKSNVLATPPTYIHVLSTEKDVETAYDLILQGQSVLWQGDYHRGKHLLQETSRRLKKINKSLASASSSSSSMTVTEIFLANRVAVVESNRVLSRVLVQCKGEYRLDLPRAPPLRDALEAAFGCHHAATTALSSSSSSSTAGRSDNDGDGDGSSCRLVLPLREVVGAVGAYEWRRRGVLVPALGPEARIYPHFSATATAPVSSSSRE
jgi:hypothetical protein